MVLDVFAGWNDPCDEGNHNMISDGRRSVSFVPGPSDSLICDNYNIIDGENMTSLPLERLPVAVNSYTYRSSM